MNPNPSPTPAPTEPAGPPAEGQAVVEFVRTQRQTAAYVFLGLSLAFLVATIWLGVRSFRTPTAEKPAETKTADEEKAPELPKAEIADPKKGDYTVGWLATLIGFLITAAAGVYLQVRPPAETPAGQRTEARKVILAAGGLLGFALIIFGGWYFYRWSDSLAKWLDKGEKKEMLWVVIPLLMVAGGAGLVFAAVQPARAEERNNTTLRRLVYGSNFGLTVLLLLVLLVATNVVIAMKVPNQLDTTETGFYTLSESTKNFLGKLPEPVNLYVIMPDSGDRLTNDIRQFAYSARDASDGKLTVRFVSPVTNKVELARLQEKYPRLGRDAEGILLTAGEDEKRSAFVPFEDLFETDPRSGRPKGFAGEAKVMREVRYLADNEQKPVVYFTQANGELGIASTPGVESVGGTANQLKGFLEKAYLEVKPLVFPLKNPSVPDDAAVVVVAEPQTPLSNEAVDALRRYMNPTKPGAKKGKLIVLAGATPGPNERGVSKTGLEGLLGEFNVRLGDKFIYSEPIQQAPDYRVALVAFTQAAADNPITQTVGQAARAFRFPLPREVAPAQGGNPQYKADMLLVTLPGRETWLEDEVITNPQQTIRDVFENEAVARRKQLSGTPRSVAVVVSEPTGSPHGGPGGSGRLLVIGNSVIFSDRVASGAANRTPVTFDMIGVGIDWLRDRPPLATTVENKAYKEYQPPEPAAVDTTRLLYLPLGLGMLLIVGLGAGVWVIRRK